MGRGRQKAKHTKIARELKSYSPTVNYDQLERELTGHGHGEADYSKWADYEPDGESADDCADEYETHDQSKRA
jgi:hypothetical protein